MNDDPQHAPTGDPELDRRLAEVGVRARRRWLIAMGVVIVVVGVAVPLLIPVLDGRRPHYATPRHTGATA